MTGKFYPADMFTGIEGYVRVARSGRIAIDDDGTFRAETRFWIPTGGVGEAWLPVRIVTESRRSWLQWRTRLCWGFGVFALITGMVTLLAGWKSAAIACIAVAGMAMILFVGARHSLLETAESQSSSQVLHTRKGETR